MTWVLVFWIQFPENFTIYEKFPNELKCLESAKTWNARLRAVNSKMNAECRVEK
jgi:hypothetical protein